MLAGAGRRRHHRAVAGQVGRHPDPLGEVWVPTFAMQTQSIDETEISFSENDERRQISLWLEWLVGLPHCLIGTWTLIVAALGLPLCCNLLLRAGFERLREGACSVVVVVVDGAQALMR